MSDQPTKALSLTFEDCLQAAQHLQGSKYYPDCQNVNQAVAKILTGRELGIPPVASLVGIQIIQGKPQLSATTLAALVKRSGRYTYRVREISETVCKIAFFERVAGNFEEVGVSSFSIEDARKAGTQNLNKYPRNMLFARAMSNGFKWYCADLFHGPVYVEGEIDDPASINSPEGIELAGPDDSSGPVPVEASAVRHPNEADAAPSEVATEAIPEEVHAKLLARCHRELTANGKTWLAALRYFGIEPPDDWAEPAAGVEGERLAREMTWVPDEVCLKVLDSMAPKGRPAKPRQTQHAVGPADGPKAG